MISYETFEHGADVGVRGFGKTIEEAFANGAKALFSIMVNLEQVDKREAIDIVCSSYDLETLFTEWLNTLITCSDLNKMVFCDFELTIQDLQITSKAYGEKIDPKKHILGVEVKGATYTMLKVAEEKDLFVSQCIVDV